MKIRLACSLAGGDGSLDKIFVCLCHEVSQLDELVGVGPLIVIPGDEFDEFGAQLDTSLSIEA
jgi:hypothetical protein